jgi:molecular chaperone HscB
MDYFSLFEIPVQLKSDRNLIKKKYFELSKKYHPDYFVNADENQQQQALEASAVLNNALKTLSNEDNTIAYVLQQKGLLEEGEKYELSPDFLMEMMDINEAFSEALMNEDENVKTSLEQQLANLEKEIYEPVAKTIENYQDGVTTEKELLQVKDYYFKKKYLQRLRQQLK